MNDDYRAVIIGDVPDNMGGAGAEWVYDESDKELTEPDE